jgi:hypothetical protein
MILPLTERQGALSIRTGYMDGIRLEAGFGMYYMMLIRKMGMELKFMSLEQLFGRIKEVLP